VAGPKIVQSDVLTSFSEDMRARGMEPGGRVLDVAVEPATERLAGKLEIAVGEPVFRVVRVRTADGEPMAVERVALPLGRLPGLDASALDQASLWEELERRWDIRVGSAAQKVSSVLPSAEEAELLEIPETQPCFAIEGLTRDVTGAVLEAGRSVYRADRYDVLRHAVRSTPPSQR
jgi:GntR family transcriptional regulator